MSSKSGKILIIAVCFFALGLGAKAQTGITSSASNLPAQKPCTREDAYNKAPVWTKQGADELAVPDRTFPKADFPKVLAKAQQAAELIKKSTPDVTGLSASIWREIRGDSYFPNGALPFRASASYYDYYCVSNESSMEAGIRGTIQINPEKAARIRIFFNTLGWITNSDQDTNLVSVNNEYIYHYPVALADFKGVSAFSPRFISAADEMYMIAPPGKSPFIFVSREDYILARQKELRRKIKEMKSGKASKEKETMLAKLESNPGLTAEQKKQYREIIEKTQTSLDPLATKTLQGFEEWDRGFENLLQQLSPAERLEPAIIKNPNSPPEQKIFYTEKEGGHKLFTINKNFFNPSASRDTIQLITIYLSWDEKHSPETRVINQFRQNFDFQALRQMLGK